MKAYRRRRFECKEMVELVTDYLEGSIDLEGPSQVRGYLSECDHRAEFLQQVRTTMH